MHQTASLAYDPGTYDDLPTYEWNVCFDIDNFAEFIEDYNDQLWDHMKVAICGKLGIPHRLIGCKWRFLLIGIT